MTGIPNHLPALLHARKVQAVTSRVGFDWENPESVLDKIKEEIRELEAAHSGKRPGSDGR